MESELITKKTMPYRGTVNIFYGTTKGTSSELAEQLVIGLEADHFYIRVIHIEEFEPIMIANCDMAIFILSSYG